MVELKFIFKNKTQIPKKPVHLHYFHTKLDHYNVPDDVSINTVAVHL